MFLHKTPLFMCTLLPLIAPTTPQTYFHDNGSSGSFTSVTRGHTDSHVSHQAHVSHHVSHQAQNRAYVEDKPQAYVAQPTAYQAAQPKTYFAKPQTYQAKPQTYHAQPQAYHAQPQTYHTKPKTYQPQSYPTPHNTYQPTHSHPVPPASHGPAPVYDEKCSTDYVETTGEVCLPSFEVDCEREEGRVGLMVRQEQECHMVTSTVCVEREEVEENEICAYTFHLVPVDTEVKLADVRWDKSCKDETVCVNPHHVVGGYSSPTTCTEQYRHICHLQPVLYPLVKKVTVKLPQPLETCIVKTVRLPRIECDQVRKRRCITVPKTEERKGVKLSKCRVEVGESDCQETVLQLPRQACLGKIKKVRTLYQVEETVSYSG